MPKARPRRPPYGRVPELEIFNLDHYCHEGPLARTVADCALLQNIEAIKRVARIHFGMIFGPSIREIYAAHADELTTGLSIVAKTYDDVTVFHIAAAYEQRFPWLDSPDRHPALSGGSPAWFRIAITSS
jgi:Asp-tRNA(Asn)/Glu-tRNA(Gln) amidotransferase A subunit family amidase